MAPCPPWAVGSPSSGRARPAKSDSPAASADVQPRGRNDSARMSQTDSCPACHPLPASPGRAAPPSS